MVSATCTFTNKAYKRTCTLHAPTQESYGEGVLNSRYPDSNILI